MSRLADFCASRAFVLLAAGIAALPLSACGAGDNDPGAGGVTVGEARALDEAAEMLDERRRPEKALPAEGKPEGDPDAVNKG